MQKPPVDIFTFDVLCEIFAFLPFKNVQLLSTSSPKLFHVSQQLLNWRPLQIQRPYEKRVLEKLAIVAGDPGLEFMSAEFVFRQQQSQMQHSEDENTAAPVTFLRELDIETKYNDGRYMWTGLTKHRLRIGYRNSESSASFDAMKDFNRRLDAQFQADAAFQFRGVKIGHSKQLKLPDEFVWLPSIAPPSDVIAIEHICLELVHNIWSFFPDKNSEMPVSKVVLKMIQCN